MIGLTELTRVSPPVRSTTPVEKANGPMADGPVDDAEETIDLLYRRHSGALFSYLVRLSLGDHRLAEDILQETLLRAWTHLRRHPTAADEFRPWMYTVARRILVDILRARRSRPPELMVDDLTTLSNTDNDIDRLIDVLTVRNAVTALRPEQRTLLIDLYYHGRTPQEVATALGIPLGTVKSRTHYALRALRQHVAD
jgi:RNA polymerase sigma-70 factor (ECF subfamily)